MIKIEDVINDLNVSIADMETLMSVTIPANRIHISRAIGQLKAARGCLLVLVRQEVQSV